ncbi:MAG: kinase [Elusimicrobia bacterium RIFCSPLOWO2_02_FULL_39_32]|nr:MAG: kinase [Elusimicrobia bacterium RIFCSPHIGHO2_02_FULL_39_36]OGR92160.1 MAG: kinase [Elusimicrobia bacterium RIFCSPLOWO2_02_FULL_39_32]OGR99972.1 MAG: kinase [Elusimicrobia bacterium RIFCSPLOWO2_12_FULL_39_28]
MIISKTPFRISFFGGGTDYPVWFKENGGSVLVTSIDKYCYISSRYLPPFFEYKSRILYSQVETINKIEDIKHPSVRECLEFMKIKKGMEIHHDADLPARTGLGSSSSFTVGLLNTLNALKGKIISQNQLAKDAIHVEQNLLKENVGCQDQIAATYGGFNLIEFKDGQENFRVYPITIKSERLTLFHSHLMLIFTGFSRIASEIAKELVQTTHQRKKELKIIHQMVNEGLKILSGNGNILEFGKLLHESWKIKRGLTSKITTPAIDEIYSEALKAGAKGGKLLGAGGGGFVLLFAEPAVQPKIKARLKKFLHVPFQFENSGSQIIFYKEDQYK